MATTALEEEKKRKPIGYAFPQNAPPGGSIYGVNIQPKSDTPAPAPVPSKPIGLSFPQNPPPGGSIYGANIRPAGEVVQQPEPVAKKPIGFSFPQNPPEGGSIYRKRPLASDAKEQSGGLGVVTQAGPSLNAPWYSREYATAANLSDKSGIDLERMRAAGATGIPQDDPMRRLAAVGTLSTGTAPATPAQPSPAAKPVPSGTSLVTASQSQRGEGSMPATPATPATTNQGLGIVRVDAPGASPLFTNLPTNDPSNVGLMARRAAPSAQNVGAMDALAGRYEANTTAQAQAMIDAEQAAASRMTPGQAYLQQAQASMPSFKGMTRLQAATAQQQFQEMNRVRGDAARLDQDAARTRQDAGLGIFRAQDEASTNALRRKAVQADLDTKSQLDAARQEYLAAGDDPAKQKAAAKKLAVLNGKSKDDEWGVQVTPATKNLDGTTTPGSVYKYNKATGDVVPVQGMDAGGQAVAGPKPSSKNIAALKSDPSLAAAFDQQFGAGASKQYIQGK